MKTLLGLKVRIVWSQNNLEPEYKNLASFSNQAFIYT